VRTDGACSESSRVVYGRRWPIGDSDDAFLFPRESDSAGVFAAPETLRTRLARAQYLGGRNVVVTVMVTVFVTILPYDATRVVVSPVRASTTGRHLRLLVESKKQNEINKKRLRQD